MEKMAKILGVIESNIPATVRNFLLIIAVVASICFNLGGYLTEAKAIPPEIREIKSEIIATKIKQGSFEESLRSINAKLDNQNADIKELRNFIMGGHK